jgi:sugar transferase (PEP-CTERM system associated)
MLLVLRHAFTRRILATLIFELVVLNICFLFCVKVREVLWTTAATPLPFTIPFSLACSIMVQYSLWSFGLYSREVIYSGKSIAPNLLFAASFSGVLLFPVCYVFSLAADTALFAATWRFYGASLLPFATVSLAGRLAIMRLFEDAPFLGNILILGTGDATQQVIQNARKSHGSSFRIGGLLSESQAEVGSTIHGCEVIGTFADLERFVPSSRFSTVLISVPVYSPSIPVEPLLKAKVAGTRVLDTSDFYENTERKILLEKLDPVRFLFSENLVMTRYRWFLKDGMEKIAALVLLLLSCPVMLLTAALIKLTSPGPVFYRQWRTGKDGKRFKLTKFRSMGTDAEKDGAVWAKTNDPRVTWIGRIIRKARIDELPQLFNVLAGEMAFVGPRPERPEFVSVLNENIASYNQRNLVKPGITGWAQVCFPYGASIEDSREKLRYDLYYIKNMSIFLDMMIILATIRTVLFKRFGR